MALTKSYEFKVEITCEGCVNALKNSLTKTYGDRLVNVDANVQTRHVVVTIKGDPLPSYEEVTEAVKKTGKEVTTLNQ